MATPLDPPPGVRRRPEPWPDAPTEVLPSVTAWTPVPPPSESAPAPADPWAQGPTGRWGEPVSSAAPPSGVWPGTPPATAGGDAGPSNGWAAPFPAPAQPGFAAPAGPSAWPPPPRLPQGTPAYGWAPPAGVPVVYGAPVVWARPSAGERRWAVAAHAVPLLTHWVGPLVILVTRGRRSETVRRAAASSFSWEVTVALLVAVSLLALKPWGLLGPVIAALVVAFSVALHVYGALVAARGEDFEYPALPFIR